MYTLSEFRKNTRQAFNDASEGHQVVIERYDQKFQLVALVDKPLAGHSFESVPKKSPVKISRDSAHVLPDVKHETPSQKADREVLEERARRMSL